MRKISWNFILISTMILILIAIFFFMKGEDKNSNAYNHSTTTYYHSTTMNIIVLEKLKDKNNNSGYSIKVKNDNTPYQEYSIVIDDEKLWNLINVDSPYFVMVSWESTSINPIIENQTTTLLQIENLNIE